LLYWQPQTMAIIQEVGVWRRVGLPVCYTIDAGPNVHVICPTAYTGQVMARLNGIPGVSRIIPARPGGAARLVEAESDTDKTF
jgi:diphosphomevalonate decarboxylase